MTENKENKMHNEQKVQSPSIGSGAMILLHLVLIIIFL